MTTALITGITGQDGSYLAEFLLEQGYRVAGMVRRTSANDLSRIEHIQNQIEIAHGDLLDQGSLYEVLDTYRPDEVYNLGGQSNVQLSCSQAVLTAESTALGVARLLDCIRQVTPQARFYQASTSEMFGEAQIKLGLAKELRLGNLDAQRDWGFAGDYVRAMWLMLQGDQPADYVIGSGQLHSVRDPCLAAFAAVGLDYCELVTVDPAFYRPAEVHPLVADPSQAQQELGWAPDVAFEALVEMMVRADLAALGA